MDIQICIYVVCIERERELIFLGVRSMLIKEKRIIKYVPIYIHTPQKAPTDGVKSMVWIETTYSA